MICQNDFTLGPYLFKFPVELPEGGIVFVPGRLKSHRKVICSDSILCSTDMRCWICPHSFIMGFLLFAPIQLTNWCWSAIISRLGKNDNREKYNQICVQVESHVVTLKVSTELFSQYPYKTIHFNTFTIWIYPSNSVVHMCSNVYQELLKSCRKALQATHSLLILYKWVS